MSKIVNESGKKKTAIAKATIREGKGRVRINSIPIELITPELVRLKMVEPLELAGELRDKVDMNIKVKGGGIMGQAGAVRTAIARGLVEWSGDVKLKEAYHEYDRTLLVSDTRSKERKMFGGPGARARRQKSYR
ncbi:MAG: 30S ribosomal protein S9 [Methermicoccaceae archaeon]